MLQPRVSQPHREADHFVTEGGIDVRRNEPTIIYKKAAEQVRCAPQSSMRRREQQKRLPIACFTGR